MIAQALKSNPILDTVPKFLARVYGDKIAKAVIDAGARITSEKERALFYRDSIITLRGGKPTESMKYRVTPVGIDEFLTSPYYLNLGTTVYPEVEKALREITEGDYVEVLAVGSIGAAKTSLAVWGTAYELYKLSCMRNPHKTFKIADTDEILIICQAINEKVAKRLDYARLKAVIEKSPYFRENFMFDRGIESELKFPNRIIVRPIGGADTSAIGENVIGGIIDELNFMAVVEKSKQSIDGGEYNQAIAVYRSISKRRKSRFMTLGKTAGVLYLVSSRKYPGQFTDMKEEERLKELKETGKTLTYLYDKRMWDVVPKERFSGETFKVFAGDPYHSPFIITDDRDIPEGLGHLVIDVPIEYKSEFEVDMMGALRDIAGVATIARHPYIGNSERVLACFSEDTPSVFSRTTTDFVTRKLKAMPNWKDPKTPRYVHIDLAVSGDSCGFAIGHVEKFVKVERGDHTEILPHIVIDGTLEIIAPKGGEIEFARVRRMLYVLRDKLKLNIKWVTFDQFQSKDSMQILARKGFITGHLSTETSITPYSTLKSALMDGRVEAHRHKKLVKEILSLEYDAKKAKVDHPAGSSNDIADALCGVVYGLTTRAEIWAMHGVTHDLVMSREPKPKGENDGD